MGAGATFADAGCNAISSAGATFADTDLDSTLSAGATFADTDPDIAKPWSRFSIDSVFAFVTLVDVAPIVVVVVTLFLSPVAPNSSTSKHITESSSNSSHARLRYPKGMPDFSVLD